MLRKAEVNQFKKKYQDLGNLFFPTVEAIKASGFKSMGAGLFVKATDNGRSQVWQMSPTDDGDIRLTSREDFGYNPEICSLAVTKKVCASAPNQVMTEYGQGTLVGDNGDGFSVVAINKNGEEKRWVLKSESIKPVPPEVKINAKAEPMIPSDTPLRVYETQHKVMASLTKEQKAEAKKYFTEAYGDAAYANELVSEG